MKYLFLLPLVVSLNAATSPYTSMRTLDYYLDKTSGKVVIDEGFSFIHSYTLENLNETIKTTIKNRDQFATEEVYLKRLQTLYGARGLLLDNEQHTGKGITE